jgi:hypothetical protein
MKKLTPEQKRVFKLIVREGRAPEGEDYYPLPYIPVTASWFGTHGIRYKPGRDSTLLALIRKGLLREVKPASRDDLLFRYVEITHYGWVHFETMLDTSLLTDGKIS